MKRIVCMLLAIIMIAGMLPMAAFAASERTTSAKAINILKEYEGFESEQYEDGGKYYIGYGNEIFDGEYPDGITESEALELLKKHVHETVDVKLNAFTQKNNLTLSQYQHDALALFTYNVGHAWMSDSSSMLRSAVLNKATGNTFINAMAQWNGGDPSSDLFKGLMNRRLSEAAIYLNNSYSFYAPSNFTYVVLDVDGDGKVEASDEVVAYNTKTTPDVDDLTALIGLNMGDDFLGWYLSKAPISSLSSSQSKKTLVAKWDSVTGLKYSVNNVQADGGIVYESAKYNADKVGTLATKGTFAITKEKMVKNAKTGEYQKWAYGSGKNTKGKTIKGWICLDNLETANAGDKILATGTVSANNLNVREGASTDSNLLGSIPYATTVNIYEFKNLETATGTQSWGRILYEGQNGWINLAHVDMEGVSSTDNISVIGQTAKIVNANKVNFRDAAGTEGTKVLGTLSKGKSVTVLETAKVDTGIGSGANDALWARVQWDGMIKGYNQGWVYMYYLDVNMPNADGTTSSETVKYSAVVISNTNLNVRKSPKVSAALVKSLPTGTKVDIYEVKTTNGVKWGRIAENQWICMQYVNIIETSAGSSTNTTAVTGKVVNCVNGVNIRSAAGIGNALTGTAALGSTLNIYETVTVDGVEWGRTDKGWVCMLYISLNGKLPSSDGGNTTTTVTTTTGTVTAKLDIYKEATNNSTDLGDVAKGTEVTIQAQTTQQTQTGSRIWGKVTVNGITGWINLAYVSVKTTTTVVTPNEETETTAGINATITDCVTVNVRSAAGVGSPLVTTLASGTKVIVFEQVNKDNAPWARIKWNNNVNEGWVSMNYVTLGTAVDTTTSTPDNSTVTGTTAGQISATGYVNSNIDLNVRAGAGLNYAKVSSLKKGAKVTVYEQVTADGMIWGKVNVGNISGWICMNYITIESSSAVGGGVMGTIARCFNAVNVRSAPGTGNALVGTIQVGTRVEIFEQTQYSGQYWGRVSQGWICMDYVLLDSALPPVTDGTGTPTTAPTAAPTTAPTEAPEETKAPENSVNTDGEIAMSFSGTVSNKGDDLEVRKDASASAHLSGSVMHGKTVNILAIKGKGTDVWGRINDYSTPGWINLNSVDYVGSITGYIKADATKVYSEADTASAEVDSVDMNTYVVVNKLAIKGTKVFGYVNNEFGWINMADISATEVAAIPVYHATESAGMNVEASTAEMIKAYNEPNGAEVVFKLHENAKVYFNLADRVVKGGKTWFEVVADGKTAWVNAASVLVADDDSFGTNIGTTFTPVEAYTVANGTELVCKIASGADIQYEFNEAIYDGRAIWVPITVDGVNCWINLCKMTISIPDVIRENADIRTTIDATSDANIMGVLEKDTVLTVRSLQFAADGDVWAQIAYSDPAINGGYVHCSYLVALNSLICP